MASLQDIQPGQMLGRYEFLLPIAEGGMASVWAARLKGTRGFSKNVAIKTMLPGVSDDPQFEQMFLDEAQIASRIRHPNVAEILDLGEQDEVLYLVMEWVEGEPLANLRRASTKHGGFPRGIAVRIVADACAGLHAAHELRDEAGELVGLVHRDISPQNILLSFDGVVKIVDFGVAKAAGRSSAQTTAGQVKGKPPYMSPEQALGEAVDRRTDVFALGIILYQLTTGKHPFRGESDLVTLQNIVSDRPIVPPRAYDKAFPKALEAVVLRALERSPAARFQSCAELGAALDEVFGAEVPRARQEDVGRFMREMFGDRGEERRRALAEAARRADERAAGRLSSADLGPALGVSSLTPASGVSSVVGAAREEEAAEGRTSSGTPLDAELPGVGPPRANPARRWVFGGVAALGAATVLAVALRGGGSPAAPVTVPAEPSPAAAPAAPAEPARAPAAPAGLDTADGGAVTAAADAGVAPLEPAASPSASGTPGARAPRRAGPRAPSPAPAPAKAPSPAPSPAPRKGSGFVPPPLSNPGF